MASEITTLVVLISFLYMQCLAMHDDPPRLPTGPELLKTAEANIFFHYNTLKSGERFRFYFQAKEEPSKSPRLLPRHQSDSIPFSTSRLRSILDFFSFPDSSKEALAVGDTLAHCESPPIKGETRFCATSLESMLDFVVRIFGDDSKFKLVATSYLGDEGAKFAPLQIYTVSAENQTAAEIISSRVVTCHLLPYPYAVFFCHSLEGGNRVYTALLEGDDGGRVEAAAICHMDTSGWDPLHVAFRILGTGPGLSPVCHVLPRDSLVWVALQP